MGPVGRVGDEAVFGGVVVDVVHVVFEVRIVADRVVPEASLP